MEINPMAGLDPDHAQAIISKLPPVERQIFFVLNNIADSLDDSQIIPAGLATAITHLGALNQTLQHLDNVLTNLNTTQNQLATMVAALSANESALSTTLTALSANEANLSTTLGTLSANEANLATTLSSLSASVTTLSGQLSAQGAWPPSTSVAQA